ncbi:MAG: hypothetical protein JWQ32_1169 [Marmoricola sp.]|nr:hypothetical protein [Marmoricola sp.]
MGGRERVEVMAALAALAEREDRDREAALPHLVACVDTASGASSYSGPYPSRDAAAAAARYEAAIESGPECRLRFSVEPVFPPIGYHLRPIRTGDAAR